jgi:predicted nucleotidyltransferase
MAENEIKKLIKYLITLLGEKGVEVQKIIIFGSYARGTATADSDLDMVIISKDFRGKGIFERAKKLQGIEWQVIKKFMVPLDIITMSPDDFQKGISPVSQFARTGRIVYDFKSKKRSGL